MDKRTLIGLIVIGAILFGFTWYNSSIQEKLAQMGMLAELLDDEPIDFSRK